jgi:hypothetical protein
MFLDIDGNRVFTLSFGQGPRTILAPQVRHFPVQFSRSRPSF